MPPKTALILLLQLPLLAAVLVLLVIHYDPGSPGRLMSYLAPPEARGHFETDQPAVEELEHDWIPLEKLELMEGPWRTQDGSLLVSVAARGTEQVSEAGSMSWRLTLERDDGPTIMCGLFEHLQYADPPDSRPPWRLGYCKGREVDPGGPSVATRVVLLRQRGVEYLRFVFGTELDVDLYQVQ